MTITIEQVSGVVNDAKKATDTVKKMADHAAEITKGVAEYENFREYIKYANYLGTASKRVGQVSQVIGLVGCGISLLMIFISSDDEDQVTKGIKEIQNQISDLRKHLDDQLEMLSKKIEISNTKIAITTDLSTIETASDNMKHYREAKEAGEAYDVFEKKLLDVKTDELQTAVKHLKEFCSKDATVPLLSDMYDVSCGDAREIYILGHQIYAHALMAASLDGMITTLQSTKEKQDKNQEVTEKDVLGWQKQVADAYEDDINAIATGVTEWIEKCLNAKNSKENIEKYMSERNLLSNISVSEQVYDSKMGSGYVRASIQIMNALAQKFQWFNFAVIVYDPVMGFESHGYHAKATNVLHKWNVEMKDGRANLIIRWLGRMRNEPQLHTQTHVTASKVATTSSQKFIQKLVFELSGNCGGYPGFERGPETATVPPSADRCRLQLRKYANAPASEASSSSLFWYLRQAFGEVTSEIPYGFSSQLPVYHCVPPSYPCGFIALGIYPFS